MTRSTSASSRRPRSAPPRPWARTRPATRPRRLTVPGSTAVAEPIVLRQRALGARGPARLRAAAGRRRSPTSPSSARPRTGRRDDARWSGMLEVIPTKADYVLDLLRANSLWPLLSGLACCAIEMMSFATSQERHRPLGRLPVPRLAAPGRRPDRRRHADHEDGRAAAAPVGADAGAQVVRRDGRLHLLRRALQAELLHGRGHRPDHARRRLRPRLPAAPRGPDLRDDEAPAARSRIGAATGRSGRSARRSRPGSRAMDRALARRLEARFETCSAARRGSATTRPRSASARATSRTVAPEPPRRAGSRLRHARRPRRRRHGHGDAGRLPPLERDHERLAPGDRGGPVARRPARPVGDLPVAGRRVDGARDLRHVRDHVRGQPRPAPDLHAARLHELPAPQGLLPPRRRGPLPGRGRPARRADAQPGRTRRPGVLRQTRA